MLAPASPLLALVTVGSLLGAKNHKSWTESVEALKSDCCDSGIGNEAPLLTEENLTNARMVSWESLPSIVKRYLNNVFSPINYGDRSDTNSMSLLLFNAPKIQMLRFHQVGTLFQNNAWRSMSAVETISARSANPGSVWQAEISVTEGWWKQWLPKVLVCDAWVHGEGHLLASLQGVIPLITDRTFQEHHQALQKAEMTRFLTEAFLTPTILLPEAGVVSWEATDDAKKAILTLKCATHGTTCEVEVKFGVDIIVVSGYCPRLEGSSFVNRPWTAKLSNFQCINSMWIPTQMECGWINVQTGGLDLYFVAENSEFEFELAVPLTRDPLL